MMEDPAVMPVLEFTTDPYAQLRKSIELWERIKDAPDTVLTVEMRDAIAREAEEAYEALRVLEVKGST